MVGTEFNFQNDIYCEVTFLGDFTLEDCATQCQNGPYVACDRFNDASGLTSSCYGYSELFEGGCFTRVPNEFYDSWLTVALVRVMNFGASQSVCVLFGAMKWPSLFVGVVP